MGKVCSTEQSAEQRQREQQKEKTKSHLVEIDQKEIILAKLMVQRDRFEAKIRDQDEKESKYKAIALKQAKEGRKEEAIYTLKKIKRIKSFRKNLRNKLEFVDRQVDNIENAMDDVSFTKTLADSNRCLEELNNQIDMEEIAIAKELEQEGKMRAEELDALLDDSDDEDLRDELNQIEANMLNEGLDRANIGEVKQQEQQQVTQTSAADKELEAILA